MTSTFDPTEHPHRRYNPLLKTHVLVSPHRTKRPWLGQVDPPSLARLPAHDPTCYLCPGVERIGNERVVNPLYEETYVFPNDFPALLPTAPPPPPSSDSPSSSTSSSSFFTPVPVSGSSHVLCFSPRHDLTLALMAHDEVTLVVRAWKRIWEASNETYVQIFENRGSMMGASNPHPHGQVWALSYIPTEPAQVLRSLAEYAAERTTTTTTAPKQADAAPAAADETEANKQEANMLLDYAKEEVEKGERTVIENDHWLAVVPFWAVWPFETMILPKARRIRNLGELTEAEAEGLADCLRRLLVKYDNLFSCSFPYSLGLHQSPSPSWVASERAQGRSDPSQLHILIYPPLLRSSSVRKFLVGFELLAESQRDLTPEQAAQRLRDCADVHYLLDPPQLQQ